MNDILLSFVYSWIKKESNVNKTADITRWIKEKNKNTKVKILQTNLSCCDTWLYDEESGVLHNKTNSFFSICGAKNDKIEQPIILQPEIGFLGIICREIDGVMHFLMQAKIEPGNINCVQLSPTIQATKSNFTQKHGGNKPPYLDYFLNASKYHIVVDQIESEQAARFYKKRNRNIIIVVDEEIEVLSNFKWMTLGQIKELMKEDNLVNMDTRTVLSCIPFYQLKLSDGKWQKLADDFKNPSLFNSIFKTDNINHLTEIYQYINNKKMFDIEPTKLIRLDELKEWKLTNEEYVCKHDYFFKVIFCDIYIEGREVKHWCQPLIKALGIATLGLICCEDDGMLKFLVKAQDEIGSFDGLELGPTIQKEAKEEKQEDDKISDLFFKKLENNEGVIFDHLLSEEGGRFYHEQNRNVLLKVTREEIGDLPNNYFLVDYKTLNELVQINNILNIQLRNLLSLMEV